jgi:hypothetical protein
MAVATAGSLRKLFRAVTGILLAAARVRSLTPGA